MQMDIDGKDLKNSINIKRDLITKYLKDRNLRKISKGGKKERRKVVWLVNSIWDSMQRQISQWF